MSNLQSPTRQPDAGQDKITVLVKRLNKGDALISAERDPNKRRVLERHWCALLAEYERACKEAA